MYPIFMYADFHLILIISEKYIQTEQFSSIVLLLMLPPMPSNYLQGIRHVVMKSTRSQLLNVTVLSRSAQVVPSLRMVTEGKLCDCSWVQYVTYLYPGLVKSMFM